MVLKKLAHIEWKRFALYMARWHLSTIVMMIPMNILIFFGYVNANINLVIIQTIGACIFYNIDKWIMRLDFTKKEPILIPCEYPNPEVEI